jgi:subtilisin family serine protease
VRAAPRFPLCLLLLACAGAPAPWLDGRPAAEDPPTARLWRPPPEETSPLRLRVWPVADAAVAAGERTPALAVRVGHPVELRVAGRAASAARCRWSDGEGREGRPPIPLRTTPGVVDVRCSAGADAAFAQVTYTNAARLPVRNPYAGGVVLLKTRRTPPGLVGPVGTQEPGLGSLDRLLRRLGAYALPAFPFDRSGTHDRVGLGRWIVVDLPEETNFYQAVALLRSDPAVLPRSYLPEDATFFRVRSGPDWPRPLLRASRGAAGLPEDDGGYETVAIGAPRAWPRATGEGIAVAIVDTGVDVGHPAVSASLRLKEPEHPGHDSDGNGIPGDEVGVNFAHLAIAHGDGPPRLALGLPEDVSDWDGAGGGRASRALGHGTAIAALIAGSPSATGRVGVAPNATLLAVDVQENARPAQSALPDRDPRLRALPLDSPLRSPVWARAAGIVYAVSEGARVLTCAWSSEAPHWILHDALLFAEDNCALAVCAARADGRYPEQWRADWLGTRRLGSGEVYDAWTGESEADFFRRPLRAALLVASAPGTSADLVAPGGDVRRGIESAASRPGIGSLPPRGMHLASFHGADMSVGLAAGVAALVTGLRPDLEAREIRECLVRGARTGGALDAPRALEAAALRSEGGCSTPAERREQRRAERGPWWRRIRVQTEYGTADPSPTASRPRQPRRDR